MSVFLSGRVRDSEVLPGASAGERAPHLVTSAEAMAEAADIGPPSCDVSTALC